MLLLSRQAAFIIALIVQCVVSAPTALSVTPSVQWYVPFVRSCLRQHQPLIICRYGDDGDWSAVSIRVGTPPQWIDVMVSTVSSETWVVGRGGCPETPTDCSAIRGGLFEVEKSTTWRNQGFFELGVDKQLGNTGYAQYGLDNLTFGTSGVGLPNTIIGAFNTTGSINATQYLLGFFGLGIVPGSFNNTQVPSALSALLEKEGSIPSHSYGYTAGAKYQGKGVPNSLTLGGYDTKRFIPHNTSFTLNPSQNPEVYVNSISVQNSSTSTDLVLSPDRVSAVIDSSTPYLWLPKAACDRFASKLGLVYESTLNLYVFPANSSQRDVLGRSNLTFTFSLSDVSVSPNTVTINVPYVAFDLELTFPAIPNTVAGTADAEKYYFPLRQATSEEQYTIGRVFLQEAYLITDYERNTFSVHQALFPASPLQDTSLVSITRPSSSTLSGPPSVKDDGKKKLSTAAIVGISVGAVALIILVTLAIIYCRRRSRRNKQVGDGEKPPTSTPRTLMDRLRRHRQSIAFEAGGDTTFPTEVAADATHERFELPAPLAPAELDSEDGTFDGTTEHGSSTQDSNNISAYERVRRKLERQQIAAAHAQKAMDTYPLEKSEIDASNVEHYRPPESPREIPDVESPLVSPIGPGSAGSLTLSNGVPSPTSPGFIDTPVSPLNAEPPSYMRINPSHVVYAGRLPEGVQLPLVVPRLVGPDGRTLQTDDSSSTPNDSSLGSHYTENENADLYNSGDTRGVDSEPSAPSDEGRYIPDPRSEARVQEILAPWGSRRRLDGEDIVHVPQPAENRFSWEEERTQGND